MAYTQQNGVRHPAWAPSGLRTSGGTTYGDWMPVPRAYRILTVYQPWADFLIPSPQTAAQLARNSQAAARNLPKDVENRGSGTRWRGLLLICAAKSRVDQTAMDWFQLDPRQFVRGAVVGVVTLNDVVDDSTSPWALTGHRHWLMTDPTRLTNPVPCSGFQGAPREPNPNVLREVLADLERQHRTGTTMNTLVAVAQQQSVRL